MGDTKNEQSRQREALHQRTGVSLETLAKLPEEKLTACFNKSVEPESWPCILFDSAAAATLIGIGAFAMAHGMPFEEGTGAVMSFGGIFAYAAARHLCDNRNNKKLAAEIIEESRKAAPASKM